MQSAIQSYKLIDLFCGAGGMSAGFKETFGESLKPVWANDFNQEAVDSYNANFGEHCLLGDITSLLRDKRIEIPNADIVIGGPPCQGFSLLNRNRRSDTRKELWRPFFEVIRRSNAEIFVMENVPQLLRSPERTAIEAMAHSMGFRTKAALLRAADYGVPQLRYRAFILGCKFVDPEMFFPPLRTHMDPNPGSTRATFITDGSYVENPDKWKTVRDAIGDLPLPVGTDVRDEAAPHDLHFGRTPTDTSIQRYKVVSKEGMNRFDLQRLAPELTPQCWIRKKAGGTDLFGRLWWDRPAFTIRTEFYKPEKGRYLHPQQHRPITHREAARLQSFRDDFVFKGKKTEIAKQIGNAVPPLLAAAVARSVLRILAVDQAMSVNA